MDGTEIIHDVNVNIDIVRKLIRENVRQEARKLLRWRRILWRQFAKILFDQPGNRACLRYYMDYYLYKPCFVLSPIIKKKIVDKYLSF